MKAYGHTVWPVRDKSFWEKTHGRDVGAPLYEKKAGRKSNKRREHPSEKEEGTRLSKHGVKMHCSFCRDPNHKRPSCPELHPELKLQPQRRTNDNDNVGDPSVVEVKKLYNYTFVLLLLLLVIVFFFILFCSTLYLRRAILS